MIHDDFLQLLQNIKTSGNGHTARCPAHDDKNNSLSVAQGDDGRILVKCFAGCNVDDVCKSLGVEKKDLFSCYTSPARIARLHDHSKHAELIKNKTVPSKKHVLHDCTIAQYAQAKKIPEDFLKSLGLKDLVLS